MIEAGHQRANITEALRHGQTNHGRIKQAAGSSAGLDRSAKLFAERDHVDIGGGVELSALLGKALSRLAGHIDQGGVRPADQQQHQPAHVFDQRFAESFRRMTAVQRSLHADQRRARVAVGQMVHQIADRLIVGYGQDVVSDLGR